MDENKILDEKISQLVRSLEKDLPPELEERVVLRASAAAAAGMPRHSGLFRKWPFVWAAIPGGAALFLALILLWPALRKPQETQITEIRTQFELVDKNITIIFIQKPAFKLFEED